MNEKNEKALKELEEETTVLELRDYPAEIVAAVRSDGTPEQISDTILEYHESDIADAMALLESDERQTLYEVLDAETLADILEYTESPKVYLDELSERQQIDILEELEPVTTVEYLEELEEEERRTVLDRLDSEVQEEVSLLSSFDEDEIGSRMTTNYVSISADSTVKSAMNALVSQAADNDNISTLYVTDEADTLVGAIDLKDLIIARKETSLSDITLTSYPYVYATERIEDCIERIKSYAEDSIPVLDAQNRLLGVLISQDVTELVDEEIGEDYAKLAGLSEEEDLREPLHRSIGKRLPWLIILLGLGLLVSGVVGAFEQVVAQLTLIVCFQSLILGMSGNAGTQALAVTIRVLTDENLSAKQKLFLVGKEARVGVVNGFVLGLLSFLLIGGYIVLFKGYPPAYAFSFSLCTGLALFFSIILSGISGTVIPLIFKKMKIDPAVASGPLITTINDLVAVVSYYGLAWVLLIGMMGF